MVRIWYSVCGDGLGHAVRSETIISELIKKNKIIITAANRAYPFLYERFPNNTIPIRGNRFVYSKNTIRYTKSALKLFSQFPIQAYENLKTTKDIAKTWCPDIIISDFESVSHYRARLDKIPCISLDNIHTLSLCYHGFKKPLFTDNIIRLLHPPSDHYIIPSFKDFPKKQKNVYLVNPILRQSILKTKPKKGEHVLVYQTSPTNTRMLNVLRKHGRKFLIYGMGKKEVDGNLYFKGYNDEEFIRDLATCKYLIANGGFTAISEAIYLKKPILCIPIRKHPEQKFNAQTIRDLRYGEYSKDLNRDDLNRFEYNLISYKQSLQNCPGWDNEATMELIKKLIDTSLKYRAP